MYIIFGFKIDCMPRRVLFTPRVFRMAAKVPNIALLDGVVAPEILEAMKTAAGQLSRMGVRHALVGALAAGAWGYPRASKDVECLVGDEAFERHAGGIVTMATGIPISVGGVPIDHIGVLPGEQHLEQAVSHPVVNGN